MTIHEYVSSCLQVLPLSEEEVISRAKRQCLQLHIKRNLPLLMLYLINRPLCGSSEWNSKLCPTRVMNSSVVKARMSLSLCLCVCVFLSYIGHNRVRPSPYIPLVSIRLLCLLKMGVTLCVEFSKENSERRLKGSILLVIWVLSKGDR